MPTYFLNDELQVRCERDEESCEEFGSIVGVCKMNDEKYIVLEPSTFPFPSERLSELRSFEEGNVDFLMKIHLHLFS